MGFTRFNPSDGKSTSFPTDDPELVPLPRNIASGPDDALWLIQRDAHIARVSTAGDVTEPYQGLAQATAIGLGPDQHLWVTGPDVLWRFAP